MTDARTPLAWVRADNRAIIWWGADYPTHWEPGEGFAIYGDPSEADAALVVSELAASPDVTSLHAFCLKQMETNEDEAKRFDEEAAEWAQNPDPFKAKRADGSRSNAAYCRAKVAEFRKWARALEGPADTERLREALGECQDKLWIARCDSNDEKFRAAAERACEMAGAALKSSLPAPFFKDEAALKTSIKNLITHRAAGDYDLMADDVANALWPLIRQARDLVVNPSSVAAGAEALHRIGRHHGWWTAMGLMDRDSYRTPGDPIAQREFEGLVAEILASARVAQADDLKAASEALQQCWGALNFILAFYDPNQRHLDTNAWKQAEAGGRRAHAHARAVLDALKAQPEDEENPWRSQAEWSRLLDLRDTFIAGEGLWSLFMVSLEKREQLSRTD